MPGPDPAANNFYTALAAHFPTDRSRIAIEDGSRQITYADLESTTARLANLLHAKGIPPGGRIAAILDKSPEAICLYLAACRAGAVYLPIHVDLTPPEIDYILADATPLLVVCRPANAEHLQSRAPLTLDHTGAGTLMQQAAALPDQAPLWPGQATDPNAIVYTSGTTGRPKGAIMTNGLVIWNALALAERWQITADDILLHANPMAFGLFGTTTPILAAGARLRLLPKFHAGQVIAALQGATLFAGVPTYYARLLADPTFTRETCATMRLFLTGSAPMRADLFDAFAARTGHELLDRYGMTEALIITSMHPGQPRRPDTSGTPLSGAQLRIAGPTGTPLPAGEVGIIELQQPHPFAGYWNAPEKTQDAFRNGWFITGDFGRLDPHGNLSVLGRGVDLIITGGLNVYPKEVETSLNALPNILESAVIGLPHPDFGEAVAAIVQLTDPTAAFSPSQAQTALAQSIAKYKIPKHIAVITQLPRNTLGKIQKNQLKQQFQALFQIP